MAKTKSAYFCQSCGYQSAKWLGKCPSCESWNTLVEEILEKEHKNNSGSPTLNKVRKPQLIHEISILQEQRFSTNDSELDRIVRRGTRHWEIDPHAASSPSGKRIKNIIRFR